MEPDSATTRLALLALLLLAAPARPASAAPVEDGTLAESISSRASFTDVSLSNVFFAAATNRSFGASSIRVVVKPSARASMAASFCLPLHRISPALRKMGSQLLSPLVRWTSRNQGQRQRLRRKASSSTYESTQFTRLPLPPRRLSCSASAAASQIAMSQSQIEAAIRQAGAAVALAAASALIAGFPALEPRAHVVLALHAILLLGCAAVLLSPARGPEAARGTTVPGSLRWLGFAGIALYALHVDGDVAARDEAPQDTVRGFLLFLMFLAGVWGVYLSMVRGRDAPLPRPAAEEDSNGEEADAVAPARVVVDSKV